MARGGGLGGLLLLSGIVYYSGAGEWMLNRVQGLPGSCYGMISSIGSAGRPVCNGVSKAVAGLTNTANIGSEHLHGSKEWFQKHVFSTQGGGTSLSSIGASLQQGVAGLSSSGEQLNQMISQGPHVTRGGSTSQQFQQAVDSFTIGQKYLTQSGNAGQALPWLQQGANQPQGFGVMSQLSLGDLYKNGGNGVAPDPVRAKAYYGMAESSLSQLSSSNSPQAQQLLQALPASPATLIQQVNQSMSQIK